MQKPYDVTVQIRALIMSFLLATLLALENKRKENLIQ